MWQFAVGDSTQVVFFGAPEDVQPSVKAVLYLLLPANIPVLLLTHVDLPRSYDPRCQDVFVGSKEPFQCAGCL